MPVTCKKMMIIKVVGSSDVNPKKTPAPSTESPEKTLAASAEPLEKKSAPGPTFDELKEGLEGCFICPITQHVMFDPVFTADGHSYEAEAITQWLQTKNTSPLTRLPLDHKITVKNHALRNAIQEYIKTVPMIDRPEAFQPFDFEGVEVTGAGEPQVNGRYHLREMDDKRKPHSAEDMGFFTFEQWAKYTGGRPWYEKHTWNIGVGWVSDHCFIHYHARWKRWLLCEDGHVLYEDRDMGESDLPPLASCNWKSFDRLTKYPYPTLRVVS